MVIDNALNDSQAEAGPANRTGAIAAHERLEQMLTLLRFNSRTVIFHLEPGPVPLAAAADFNPAVAVAGGVDHHIRQRALDGERMHAQRDLARLQVGGDFSLVAAFRRNHFPQHRVKVRQLHRHLLAGAQVVDKLLDNGVTLFNIFINRLGEVAVLFAHHLRRQTDTRKGSA